MAEMNDGDLAERVRQMLDADVRFKNYDLKAEVHGGEVIVTGIVDTLSEKGDLRRALEKMPGVRAVDNAVSISTDGQINDSQVLAEVMEEFAGTPDLDMKRIGAKVNGGVVHLVGRTTDPGEIKAARKAAEKARGVRGVVNEAEVAEPAVDMALENIFHSQVRNDGDGPV